MFGIFRTSPKFIIGNSSLFTKKSLTPIEFGHEITGIGFALGIDAFEHYTKSTENGADDKRLLKEVGHNPGIMQLLHVNLITGGFLTYAKVLLEVPDEILAEVEHGILSELRTRMPGFDDDILENHKNFTTSFSIAIGREILQIEKDASISLFFGYLNHFYPGLGSGGEFAIPNGLFNSLKGYGTRVAAACQDQFKISYLE